MKRDQNAVRVDARAVDVGYFNVKYTLGRRQCGNSTSIATGLFPALAPSLATNVIMDGKTGADAAGCIVCIDGINHYVGAHAALHSGGRDPRPIDEGYCLSDKYLALFRGALNYMAVEEQATELTISQLVVGLPLHTFPTHKEALAQRLRGEHVIGRGDEVIRRITVEQVDVIVQPQGAMVNFGVNCRAEVQGRLSLVVDPGGGTLDWFMSRGIDPVWARSGAYPKAMLACANAVADLIHPDWRNQFEIVEKIDAAIRGKAETFRVGARTFELAKYQKAVDGVLEDSVKCMMGSTGPLDNLDHLIVTGGGAHVYASYVAAHFPALRGVIKLDDDPVYSNVRGFQVAAEMKLAHRRRAGD